MSRFRNHHEIARKLTPQICGTCFNCNMHILRKRRASTAQQKRGVGWNCGLIKSLLPVQSSPVNCPSELRSSHNLTASPATAVSAPGPGSKTDEPPVEDAHSANPSRSDSVGVWPSVLAGIALKVTREGGGGLDQQGRKRHINASCVPNYFCLNWHMITLSGGKLS